MPFDENQFQHPRTIACNTCKHFTPFTITCKAFPEGIPEEILGGEDDHKLPVRGDRGLRYESK